MLLATINLTIYILVTKDKFDNIDIKRISLLLFLIIIGITTISLVISPVCFLNHYFIASFLKV
ncbi:hypothetical protein LCGC14_0634780 [marine sediment metagenome]|uniref:Uncharacterized protein n=1 Tax=marine sediment metagenome TaxID=412755 RepID=A0A0F9TMD1_9ZZZZ